MKRLVPAAAVIGALMMPSVVAAENLYQNSGWAAMSTDRRATAIGDALTIVIFQAADATNTAQTGSSRATNVGGGLRAGPIDESGELRLGGSYNGRGEVRRSERFVSQITVTVSSLLPNGDLAIAGEQVMRINGETSRIGVRGRVRPADIRADNSVLSSRIVDAQINYDGRGFVSRSSRPGLINRIFSFLGLG